MPTYTGTNAPDVNQLAGGDLNLRWTMYGLDGDDILDAGLLADTVVGGEGGDTLNGLSGNDVLYGDNGDDIISGGAGADVIHGGHGANQLNGGDGADRIYGTYDDFITGGDGNDMIWFDDGRADGGAGADTFYLGSGGGIVYGDDGADVVYSQGYGWIYLGAGNDRYYSQGAPGDSVEGGDGADTFHDLATGLGSYMLGGLGNDIFYVANAGSWVNERVGQGYDIIRTALETNLADNVEAVQLEGSSDVGVYGNVLANNLQGNSGDNVLYGDAGVDTLNGGDGDDEISGGSGNDLLRGGSGADTFLAGINYGAVLETDQIYDFSTAEGDRLDLQWAYGGTLVLVSAFSKVAGQMTLSFATGITTLRIDTTGDGKADYQLKINGDVTGDSAGWML